MSLDPSAELVPLYSIRIEVSIVECSTNGTEYILQVPRPTPSGVMSHQQ